MDIELPYKPKITKKIKQYHLKTEKSLGSLSSSPVKPFHSVSIQLDITSKSNSQSMAVSRVPSPTNKKASTVNYQSPYSQRALKRQETK